MSTFVKGSRQGSSQPAELDKSTGREPGDFFENHYVPVPVAYQMRYSILKKIRAGEGLLPDIQGREETKKDIIRALLSGAHPYLVSEEGTGKTRLARSLTSLLPHIYRIKGCPYNDDPKWPPQLLCPRCRGAKDPVKKYGMELVPRGERFSRIQGNEYTNEAKLLGLKDIQAIARGKSLTDQTVFTGTGAFRANRGILFIDELPAIRTNVQVLLHPLLEEKRVILEEYNCQYPLDLILIATGNPRGFSHVYEIPRPLLDRMELIYMDMPEEEVEKEIMLRERFSIKDARHERVEPEVEDLVPYSELEKVIQRTVSAPWWIIDIINRTVRQSRNCPRLDKKASIRASSKALDHTYASVEMENREVANLRDAYYGLRLALRGRISLSPEYIDVDEPRRSFNRIDNVVEDLMWNALDAFTLDIFEGIDKKKIAEEIQSITSHGAENITNRLRDQEQLGAVVAKMKKASADRSDAVLLNDTERQLIYNSDSAGEKTRQEYNLSALEVVINFALHKGIISESRTGQIFVPKKLSEMKAW